MQRRAFLASTGVAVGATLAGCFESGSQPQADPEQEESGPDESSDEPPELSDGLAEVLGMVPQRADGFDLLQVAVRTVDPDAEGNNPLPSVSIDTQDRSGVDPADAEHYATATYGGLDRLLYIVVGSFDAETVEVSDTVATYVEDGLLVGGLGYTDPWETGVEAAKSARTEPDMGLVTEATKELMLFLGSWFAVTLYPNPAALLGARVAERVELFGTGRRLSDDETEHVSYAGRRKTENARPGPLDEAMQATGYPRSMTSVTITDRGRHLDASFEQTYPDSGGIESPFYLDADQSELVYTGANPLDTDDLELVVEDEAVPVPWQGKSLEPQDRFDIDVAPFSLVTVFRWEIDETLEIIGQEFATPQNAFTESFDEEAQRLTIEYSEDEPAPASRLRLVGEIAGTQLRDRSLSELVGETLDPGEALTVENVRYGEEIDIETRLKTHQSLHANSVFYFSESPPGYVSFERTGASVTATYRGETQPADQIRLEVDGEPTATQFGDESNQLTGGETVEIEAPAYAVIEALWTGQEIPATMREYTVPPDAEFTFEVDREQSVIEVTHAGGDAVRVGSLRVEVDYRYQSDYERGGPTDAEQLTEGDSFQVELRTDGEPVIAAVRLSVGVGSLIASEQFSN